MNSTVYFEAAGRVLAALASKPISALVAAASLLGGCFSLTAAPRVPLPTATVVADPTSAAWDMIAPGLERRTFQPRADNSLLQLATLRIDPARFTFRVHYRPGDPLTIDGWRRALPDATLIVNGNFFDENDRALGLVVADGATFGASFEGFGGLFQVLNGQPRIRSTIREPFTGEMLEQAVQAFPMLVLDGVSSYTRDDVDVSRRTVIGQDADGRVLIMVTPLAGISLPALSAYLPTTDIGLTAALNLDGGRSTMLSLNADGATYTLHSFDSVPLVLAVYRR